MTICFLIKLKIMFEIAPHKENIVNFTIQKHQFLKSLELSDKLKLHLEKQFNGKGAYLIIEHTEAFML